MTYRFGAWLAVVVIVAAALASITHGASTNVGYTPSTRGIAYWPGTSSIPPQLVFTQGFGQQCFVATATSCTWNWCTIPT
jgi:hypothetical protein